MKLIVRTGSTNEFSEGCDYALIDLTPELAHLILARKATLDRLKESDRDIEELVFTGNYPEYFATLPESLEDLDDTLYTAGHVPAPGGFTVEEPERTECDRMVIDGYGVWWRCYPKHCDWMVDTPHLEYDLIEQVANVGVGA